MKEILPYLHDLINTLEEMNKEKATLKLAYEQFHTNRLSGLNDSDVDFYKSAIELTSDYVSIEDFDPSDMMRYLYDANKEKTQALELHALKLYKLYIDSTESEQIQFLENLKSEQAQQIEIINQKDFLTVAEFEIVFGYSRTQQKGFRSRLRDPVPYSQKGHGHKVLYERRKVQKWLEDKE